ncbi:hypothetical protein KNP414_01782 [Paenibacillus mucilaginosus KNP414]|uniref:Uncharacterized protein n=1 Tax=Paenibacillus mucilaginosus (strain KNP414) TaxID=1036673 RepID=F8FQI9_PAEMK|nr:hypothetical protein KNP414_01782 [Paenibacillus mucilaginosus KNP414]
MCNPRKYLREKSTTGGKGCGIIVQLQEIQPDRKLRISKE